MTHQKKEKIFISCYYGKLLCLELFAQNLYFFTPWEVLECEYLYDKKFKITEVCLRYTYVVSSSFP